MKQINLPTNYQMYYPVGYDMKDTMPYVKYMYESLNSILSMYSFNNISLIGTGSSGAIICTLMYSIMGEDLKRRTSIKHIKKPDEKSHFSSHYFSENEIKIVLDDFIATGDTIKRVFDNMGSSIPNCVCVTGTVKQSIKDYLKEKGVEYLISGK